MAGGAYTDPEHARTIGRRLGWDRAQLPARPEQQPTRRTPAPGAPRHCWAVLDGESEPLPALLLSWERTDRGWVGVTLVAVPGTLGVLLRLPAELLRPTGQ